MVDCKKIIFLLLSLLFRHKVLGDEPQIDIRFQMTLQHQESNNLKLVSLHCCFELEAAGVSGDNMAPLVDGDQQVMAYGDDNSTGESEESLNAQLYLKMNGTRINPLETTLIEYRHSILDEQSISASYYISRYDPFYAEFSCVHNSTTTSSDLVFAYAPMADFDDLNTLIIVISMLFAFTLVLLIISCVCYCFCAARKHPSKHNSSSDVEEATISQSCSSWFKEFTPPKDPVLFNTPIYAVPDLRFAYGEPTTQQHDVRQKNCRSGNALSTKTSGRLLSEQEAADYLLNLLRHRSPCDVAGCLCSYYRKKLINSLSQTTSQDSVMQTLTEKEDVIAEPATSRLSMRDGRTKVSLPASQTAAEKDFGYLSLSCSDCEASPELNVKHVDPMETIKFDCNGGSYSYENHNDAHHEITYPKIGSYSEESPELNVKFVDPMETIKFDCNGGSYSNENHEVYLSVPKGAIPKGKTVSIQVGVSLHSALVPLLPRETRPVSPLVKLCVMGEVDFKFLKPVRVTLPHFLDIADEEGAEHMGLQFMKSGHGLYCFHRSDGEASFKSNTATLKTTHFCTFCITANQHICNNKVNYRLVKVVPKNRQESMWRVNFCVTYYLKTCLQVLKKQFPDSSFEMRTLRKFKFSSLEIYFERRLASGWQLALERGGKIFPKDVQYMDLDPEELEMMEEDGVYPPRFEVQVCGSHAREPVNALICFRGMADTTGNDTTELLLEPVAFASNGSHSQSPPYHMWHGNGCGGSEPVISQRPHSYSPPVEQRETSSRPNSWPKRSGPSHSDLMNFVAAALPTKWRIVGVQLGLSVPRLDEIERNHSDCRRCYSAVFSEWEQQETSPFCWETVVSVLQTPSVEENRVAEEVKTHFMRT